MKPVRISDLLLASSKTIEEEIASQVRARLAVEVRRVADKMTDQAVKGTGKNRPIGILSVADQRKRLTQ